MTTGTRERDQLLDGRRCRDQLGLRRPAAAHRNNDHVPLAREQAREVRSDGRLPDALARPDDCDRRQLERLEHRRIEPEVGADVREAGRERARGPAHPLGRPEHRLVREIDHRLRVSEPADQGDTVVRTGAQLFRPTHQDRSHPLVRQRPKCIPHDGRVMLAVNEGNSAHHRLADTSRSMRPVYFSYSPVARSNWMIRSCPWKG